MVAALRRRPALAAALIYAVLTIGFLAPGLLPGKTLSNSDTLWFEPPWAASKPPELTVPSNPDLGDGPEWMQLFLHHAAREMPHVPLWNPYIVGGRPFHANDQSALFGPYTWPAYILPFWTALGWIAVLKLWVAAFGTYLLGRSLGMRFGGALLAGVVFALNLKLVTWLIYPAMGVWTWYPWLLLCADRLVKRPDLLSGSGLAAVVALQFLTGHPESSFHALLLTTLFFAARLWQAHRRGAPAAERLIRPLAVFAGAALGGAAVAAVSLIPFSELLVLSADVVDRRGQSIDKSLPFGDAIGLFLPDYWGRPTQTPFRAIMLERAVYAGALPLMLAAAALIIRPTRARVLGALFAVLCFAVVFGVPPFVEIVTRLPIFSSGHNSRLIVFTLLGLALLAGWGLDQLSAANVTAYRRKHVVLAVAGALLILPVAIVAVASPSALGAPRYGLEVAWLFVDPPGRFREEAGLQVIRASSLIIWVTMAGAGLLLLALRLRGRIVPGTFVALALLLVCLDLARAGVGQNPAIDRADAVVPETGAIRFLERQRPARFVSTQEFPHGVIPHEFGLYEARGYDIPILRRYDRLWRREVVPDSRSVAAEFLDIPLELRDVTPRALRTLRLLGVSHLLGPKTLESQAPPFNRLLPVPPVRAPGVTEVYDGTDARVYRIAGALPRAWVVEGQRVVADDDAALDAITRPGFDARRVAVTEGRLPGLPERPGASDGGTARIERYEPERVVVRARSSGQGLLVLSDNHYPGWEAEVDGREVPIERVDYLFRGVRIGPGTHTVEFRYEPLSWRIGWIVSLIALSGLALAATLGWRRRARGQAARPEPTEPAPSDPSSKRCMADRSPVC
jgi:hypothetical protein